MKATRGKPGSEARAVGKGSLDIGASFTVGLSDTVGPTPLTTLTPRKNACYPQTSLRNNPNVISR